MKTPLSKYDILFPGKAFLSSVRQQMEGSGNAGSFLFRAVVVAVDHIGGKLETVPTKNPKNSIRARIISEPSPHRFLDDDQLPVFWPLFPFDVFPLKEGEHAYVVFDGEKRDHGLWLSRMAEPYETDNKNISPGVKKYQLDSPEVNERHVQDTDTPADPIEVSPEFQREAVPKFTARVGDRVLEGSNNTLIVLGRDRVSGVDSGEKEKAGTIHLIAGRQKDEVFDLENDLSSITISMKTDIDKNVKTDTVGTVSPPIAAIGIRSDEIRISARKGVKIVVEGGDLIIDANTISLGKTATDFAILGDKLVQYLRSGGIVGALGSVPIPAHPAFADAVQQFLSKKNKIE